MASRVSADQVDQQVVPGPCGPGGCPPPTEIECIEVNKVYDLCFQAESVTREFTVTDPTVISCICTTEGLCSLGATVPCLLGPISCFEVSRTPTGTEGFAAIVLQISVPVNLYPIGSTPTATTTPCDTETAVFTKRVTLCAPDTTVTTSCTVTGTCDSMILTATGGPPPTSLTIETVLNLCVTVKTIADVNLLVPAYGFCIPAECVTMGLACPTFPPPQCFVADDAAGGA